MINKQDNYKELIKRQSCPMLASANTDPEKDTKEQLIEMFKKVDKLPMHIRYGMMNENVSDSILNLSKEYQIEDPRKIGNIARLIRDIYIEKISERETKHRIEKELELERKTSERFVKDLKGIILMVKNLGKKEYEDVFEKLPLIPALKKYEELAKQEITSGTISKRDTDEVVSPTIKNWLDDYIQNKGAQSHNSMERGNYLHDSDNTRELSKEEKNKLELILRSYDKDEPVTVHRKDQEIYFEGERFREPEGKETEKKEIIKTKELAQPKIEEQIVHEEKNVAELAEETRFKEPVMEEPQNVLDGSMSIKSAQQSDVDKLQNLQNEATSNQELKTEEDKRAKVRPLPSQNNQAQKSKNIVNLKDVS